MQTEFNALLAGDDREGILKWLAWNDPNGTYLDSDCLLEDLPCLDLEMAKEYMRQAGDFPLPA